MPNLATLLLSCCIRFFKEPICGICIQIRYKQVQIMKHLLIVGLIFFALLACKKKEAVSQEKPVSEGEYHLNILYGTTQNYTGNDG